jgi:hypothetical protein
VSARTELHLEAGFLPRTEDCRALVDRIVAGREFQRASRSLPGLTDEVEWIRISRLPVGPNEIAVEHHGARRTSFTNQSGPPVEWRPGFQLNRKSVALAAVTVRSGETRTAKLS